MRTAQDYKKLVEGYCFGLSQLKQLDERIYNKFRFAIDMLNRKGCIFAELVRDLKIDFINENDEIEDKATKYFTINNGFNQEMFAMGYSPKNEYALGLLYIKRTPFGMKRWFYEINPVTLEQVKENEAEVDLFRISKIDEEFEAEKCFVYVPRIGNNNFFLVEVDVDKPLGTKRVFETKLDCEKDIEVENLF